jgi:hypothetical protein
VDARNRPAHDRGDAVAHIDTPEVVNLALHTLWLMRSFVASVEKVRERRPTVERGVEGVSSR